MDDAYILVLFATRRISNIPFSRILLASAVLNACVMVIGGKCSFFGCGFVHSNQSLCYLNSFRCALFWQAMSERCSILSNQSQATNRTGFVSRMGLIGIFVYLFGATASGAAFFGDPFGFDKRRFSFGDFGADRFCARCINGTSSSSMASEIWPSEKTIFSTLFSLIHESAELGLIESIATRTHRLVQLSQLQTPLSSIQNTES